MRQIVLESLAPLVETDCTLCRCCCAAHDVQRARPIKSCVLCCVSSDQGSSSWRVWPFNLSRQKDPAGKLENVLAFAACCCSNCFHGVFHISSVVRASHSRQRRLFNPKSSVISNGSFRLCGSVHLQRWDGTIASARAEPLP